MVRSDRLASVRERLLQEACAGLLISKPEDVQSENLRYLTGFTGSTGYALLTADHARLLVDGRYVERAGQEAPDFEIVAVDQHIHDALAAQLKELRPDTLAFEAEHMTVKQHADLQEAIQRQQISVPLHPVAGWIEAMRVAKDAAEIARLRRVVLLGDRVLEAVAATIRPGMTEREVAWKLEVGMREAGAEALAFEVIVAAGPNGAMPHHRPSDRPIRAGEPIVIDMGARMDGYCSDLTRTVVPGQPDGRFWAIYQTVLRAQQACEAGLQAGMTGVQGDALARDVIAAAGYDDYFGHGTGHGVGLAVHEAPRLSKLASDDPLPEGSIVTVEPGIYLPGWGGVRIEDMVVVGDTGVEVLTTAHKRPVITLD